MNKGKIIANTLWGAGIICAVTGTAGILTHGLGHIFNASSGAEIAAKIGGAILGLGLGAAAGAIQSVGRTKSFNPHHASSVTLALILTGAGAVTGSYGGAQLAGMAVPQQNKTAGISIPAAPSHIILKPFF